MKYLLTAILSILMLFGAIGCSSDSPAPLTSGGLNYDVTGEDSPADFAAAIQELSTDGITVPDPVAVDDPLVTEEIDQLAAERMIARIALDEDGRAHFRRIIGHLHDQFQMLRRCMNQNDDPRLRRLAHGAMQAYHRGLRLLGADQPREALRNFHLCNRVLNRALEMCREGGRP